MAREKLEPRGAERSRGEARGAQRQPRGSPEAAQRQPRGSPEAAEGSARLQLTHWALTDWQLATHTPLTHRSPTRTGPSTLNTIRLLSWTWSREGLPGPSPPCLVCEETSTSAARRAPRLALQPRALLERHGFPLCFHLPRHRRASISASSASSAGAWGSCDGPAKPAADDTHLPPLPQASDGLNPVSSQGYAEIQAVEARSLALAGQIAK
jgi:hypothetical protein